MTTEEFEKRVEKMETDVKKIRFNGKSARFGIGFGILGIVLGACSLSYSSFAPLCLLTNGILLLVSCYLFKQSEFLLREYDGLKSNMRKLEELKRIADSLDQFFPPE